MQRNLACLTLAISALLGASTLPALAAPLPVTPDQSVPVSHYITQLNTDKSVTFRLFAPGAKRVSVVTGSSRIAMFHMICVKMSVASGRGKARC